MSSGLAPGGSVVKTSVAAPRIVPPESAAKSASSFTTPPRAQFTRIASLRMSENSRAPIESFSVLRERHVQRDHVRLREQVVALHHAHPG